MLKTKRSNKTKQIEELPSDDEITIVYASLKDDTIKKRCENLVNSCTDESSLQKNIRNLRDADMVNKVVGMLITMPSEVKEENQKKAKIICTNIIKKINKHYLNYQDSNGATPLHTAIIQKDYALARDLFYHGARLDIKNNNYLTPLELATKLDLKLADYLMGLAMCPSEDERMFYEGKRCISTRIEECKHLLQPLDINNLDNSVSSCLPDAVKQDLFNCTLLLIKYGANPYIKNKEGKTTVELVESEGSDHMKKIFKVNNNFKQQLPAEGVVVVEENSLELQPTGMKLTGVDGS